MIDHPAATSRYSPMRRLLARRHGSTAGASGLSDSSRPGRIIRVLRQLNADVLTLQEVEHQQVDGTDLLDYLAAATGLTAVALEHTGTCHPAGGVLAKAGRGRRMNLDKRTVVFSTRK